MGFCYVGLTSRYEVDARITRISLDFFVWQMIINIGIEVDLGTNKRRKMKKKKWLLETQ